jgi:RNA ligase
VGGSLFDIEELRSYVSRGLLSEDQRGGCSLFNYTRKCQFSGAWDPVTLQSRGLVLESATGRVLGLPWPKFFNHNEPGARTPGGIPDELTVKMDGSLGISYHDLSGRVRWTTRGRFSSPQGALAEEMWKSDLGAPLLSENLTLLAEILHPSIESIVRYPWSGLVLLGARDKQTGRDLPYAELVELSDQLGMPLVEKIPSCSPQELAERVREMTHEEEGFVARWGDHRVKFKSKEYLALARVLSGLSDRTIGDLWYAGKLNLPEAVSEETRQEAEELFQELSAQAEKLEGETRALFGALSEKGFESRRDFALAAKAEGKDVLSLLMSLYQGEEPDWRALAYRNRFGNRPR